MKQIELEIIEKEGQVKVTSPYNQKFIDKARNLRGKWKDGSWWFDDSIVDYVRDLMMECFNTTGETPYYEVNLLIKDYSDRGDRSACELFGRTIANAWGRDSGARLGDNIVLISGKISSGGSVKNWSTYVENATFLIKNFPFPSTDLPDVRSAIQEGWCEIKYPKKKRSDEEIKSEIQILKERISKLETELKNN